MECANCFASLNGISLKAAETAMISGFESVSAGGKFYVVF